ncbi:GNAT family N-acetyltransferase [Longispora albida]|uniref:GNAT family N-acetyltransferase n=1 Tax=Longispora albida TaxID=203523 RepID=UPI0004769DA4|nr:N-acetyltransferase [Longispora albida]
MTAQWRTLTPADLPALASLTSRCLAADGGLPMSADPGFLRSRYFADGGRAIGAFDGPELVASAGARPAGFTGQVDPARRGTGLGSHIMAWGLPGVAETEAWTPEAGQLFERHGLTRTFGELVMTCALTAQQPVSVPAGVTFEEWQPGREHDFFHAYTNSFADRPGFPGWTAEYWIDWISDPDDFAPAWSLLARSPGGEPAGFVACSPDPAISQAGVVPGWRRHGLGRALLLEAHNRMLAAGETSVLLMVATNNPGAEALYRSLGYDVIGQRARYSV